MENAITAISTAMSPTVLWGQIGTVAAFVASVSVVALGFYLIKRASRKATKLKGGF